ncbi:MAG: UDP-N-acetylmuramoyl-L-alanine--D-glutamate ligase [Pontibacterium sp.]
MSLIASDNKRIIIGLGATGLSCARYLTRKGLPFAVVDTRDQPAGLDAFKDEFPGVDVRCGEPDADYLATARELIVSPGVPVNQPAIQSAVKAGVQLSGDIDLFCREVSAPIIAITGSNAKSTVTTLVGEMALAAGINTGIGGNLGIPVLDMLAEGEKALYVLELSSFQLETTHELRAEVATVLNVSPDHLDRYTGMQAYYQAKHRVFRGCRKVVINRDDALTSPLLPKGVESWGFHLGRPDLKVFGLIEEAGETWLALGHKKLLPASALKIRGQHNVANALAALALGSAAGLPLQPMLSTLSSFGGLKHRCQWVADREGVSYFNDSKGTNVGATVAAINGLGATLPEGAAIVLIAGGVGKGAEFTELSAPLNTFGRAAVLIGEAAPEIRTAVEGIRVMDATGMSDAVNKAAALAKSGDIVLLSPACASFDMFRNFNERGDLFIAEVEAL